jgi:tRNA pseudouridine38-40 synthase
MKRILLSIEYNGRGLCGWQRQKSGISVQEILENALFKACGERVVLHGSGRTDAGVHALCQRAHFDTSCSIPPGRIKYAVNAFLPPAITVHGSEEAGDNFHARFSARKKTYLYKIYNAEFPSPVREGLYWHVPYALDFDAMRAAAAKFVGAHDFASFRASGGQARGTVREIYAAALEREKTEIYFTVTGSGFLYNMVRIMAGTLADIGKGALRPEDIEKLLLQKNRPAAGQTAPADGLYLLNVEY